MIGFSVVTRNLVKVRGGRRALDDLSLSVPRGSIMGLVGENGAGKTTWMMTAAGLLAPDGGEVDLLGAGGFDAAVHSGRIAILPQDSELPLEMPLSRTLYRFGRMQGLSAEAAKKSVREVLEAVNLGDRADCPVRALSHGMRKRAMVAQCFIGNAEAVFLDEPLNGLDPVEAERLRRFLARQRGNRTLIISSHNLEDVQRLCTHVAFIARGRLQRMDTVRSITHGADRIVFTLASAVADLPALLAAAPGVEIEWNEKSSALVCSLAAFSGGAAQANRLLIPAILAQTDILSLNLGCSLEEAFLGKGGGFFG
jgi:ABC-2 type transport system ATP-binding protein